MNSQETLANIAHKLSSLAMSLTTLGESVGHTTNPHPEGFFLLLTGLLAALVGYYGVWRVTPALHAPLMALTNAISSVVIIGALIPCLYAKTQGAFFLGVVGTALAAVNICGGFLLTWRMVRMMQGTFKK